MGAQGLTKLDGLCLNKNGLLLINVNVKGHLRTLVSRQRLGGVQTKAWRCPLYETVDWYWFNENNSPCRILLSNQTNPGHHPLLGNFALVRFASYETGSQELKAAYMRAYRIKKKELSQNHILYSDFTGNRFSFVKGFSAGCSVDNLLLNWPQQMHIAVTMVLVLLGLENPLPTLVVYDWKRQSQRTIMCESFLVYNAYLIVNNTYITNQFSNGTIKCLSHHKFGPQKPSWMTLDNCKCVGTVTDNSALSPSHLTTIAVCPLTEDQVFWTGFSNDTGFCLPKLSFLQLKALQDSHWQTTIGCTQMMY